MTTSFVCFEPLIGNQRVKLKIAEMRLVTKAKYLKVFPTAMKIQMADMEAHKFSGLLDRDAAFNLIMDRAKAIGNKEIATKKDPNSKVQPEKETCIVM